MSNQLMTEVNVPVRGLHLDAAPYDVGKDRYTYASCAVVEDATGNKYRLGNEHGNEVHLVLPFHSYLGSIMISRTEIVIFSKSDVLGYSEIGLLKDTGEYTALIKSSGLAFSQKIRGEFKVKNGCEVIIIFSDNDNPDRMININRLDLYTLGEITADEANAEDLWDVNEMRLQPNANLPSIELGQVFNSGGILTVGTYAFQLEYVDAAGNSYRKGITSPTIPIYASPVGASYYTISGAFSDEIRVNEDGGVPKTNKSILLNFNNIDTRFSYMRLNVIHFSSGDGITKTAHAVGGLITISGESMSYTYTGFNTSRGDYQLDPGQIDSFPLVYETSYGFTQVDNRLTRINLKTTKRDYSAYQRTVNNITITPAVKKVKMKDVSLRGNSKNPLTYWDTRSLQSDEIYAPAIVFLHDNGEYSPAFPIPGRAKIYEDTVPISYSALNVDLQHLPVKDTYETWEVYNTGNTERTGYYEATTKYPTTKDCNGEYVWGDLAGTPIRYVRIPCRKQIPLLESEEFPGDIYANLLGLTFDNVVYPDSSIIGHYFCIAKRGEFDKTVLDTGYLSGNRFNDGRYEFFLKEQYVNQTNNVFQFTSPKVLLRQYQNGTHFKLLAEVEGVYTEASERHGANEYHNADSSWEINILTRYGSYGYNMAPISNTYRSYTTNVFIDPRTIYTGLDQDVFNASYSNNVNMFELNSSLPAINKIIYAAHKRYLRPYENLENISYVPMHSSLLTESTATVFGGDIFIAPMNIFSVLDKIEAGDTFYTAEFVYDLFVESEINWDLLAQGTGDNTRFVGIDHPYHAYVITKVADQTDDGQWRLKGYVVPEFYAYNPDYSVVNSQTEFYILPRTYNYCSNCRNLHPNLVVWSPADIEDSDIETYRINKPEDYILVGAHTGPLTAIHYDKNRILLRSNQSMFQLAPNPQVLQTDIDTAYMGTGDFLGIPPNEMAKTEYGYGGGQGRFDYIATEHGFISADVAAGKIFLFTGGENKELTSDEYGVDKWFSNNLPGKDTQLVYDPYYNRLMVFGNYTMSFSFVQNGWTSFHPYTTTHAFADLFHLYMVKDDKIYRSVDFNQQTFFGIKYKFTVEYIISNQYTTDLDCLHYYAQTLRYDNNKWKDKDFPTFDELLITTDSQSTGIQILNQRDKQLQPWNRAWDNRVKDVIFAEQHYRICAIRDLAVAGDVDEIDYDRTQWHLVPLKDKFFRVRLSFKPEEDYKLLFNLSLSQQRESQI